MTERMGTVPEWRAGWEALHIHTKATIEDEEWGPEHQAQLSEVEDLSVSEHPGPLI